MKQDQESENWSYERSAGQRFVSSSSTTSTLSTVTYLSDLDGSPGDGLDSPNGITSPDSPASPTPNRANQNLLRVSIRHRVRRSVSVPQTISKSDEEEVGLDEIESPSPNDSPNDSSFSLRRKFSLRVPFLGFNRDAKSSLEVHKRTQSASQASDYRSVSSIPLSKRSLEPSLLPFDETPISDKLTSLCLGENDDVYQDSGSGSPYKRINRGKYNLNGGTTPTAPHRALLIPEILDMILRFVDDNNVIPHEVAQRRRKPMSLRHAMLIYGNTEAARSAWAKAQSDESNKKWCLTLNDANGLFSCLLVSRLWHCISLEILHEKLYFKNEKSWQRFTTNNSLVNINKNPSVLVLHKIASAKQTDIDLIGEKIGGKLKWLEFYTCPSIVPTIELLKGNALTKIVLPGCSKVTDRVVALISDMCPQVEHLDLRACDYVSDRGLKALAKKCRGIKLLNVGRTQRGELITYKGIKHIARRTCVDTLGLAGCFVDDRAIWELAIHRGADIQRLSLNNCQFLTNDSIPRILGYTRNLCVLELRGCVQITNMKPIIQFKRYREMRGHPALIEGCEVFELRMKEAQWLMEIETSRQVIRDCLEWIYSEDNDIDNEVYLRAR